MDYFTKSPKVYAIPNQGESTIAETLVTNFCRFGIPLELHSDQGRNFESHLLQEVLQLLGVSKTRKTPLHPQSGGMVERYIKTIDEHLRKVVASHQRDWDVRLPVFPILEGIHSRHYGLDPRQPSVRGRTPTTLRPAVWSTPRQGTTHHQSCGRLSRPSTRHSQLCPPTPEAGH
jgi:transposase InsO family protein